MLNKNGERELAYVATITDKKLIEGYDRICVYYVNGWTCVGGKDEFEVGDKCVFIEPDALCPYTDVFKFLDESIDEHTGKKRADRHKIKVQKFCKGQAISAGLIVPLKAAGVKDTLEVGEFLTKDLGITYWEKEDNTRKVNISKYTSMQARHKKFFKTKLGKWLMKREWGRKLCFFFLGKKKDKKTDWPSWVVKTDEERCLVADTKVDTDIGKLRIADIVNKQLNVNVKSYNESNHVIEYKPIVSYQKYVSEPQLLKFTYTKMIGGVRCNSLTCTYDHKLFTNKGYKLAKDLNVNDKLCYEAYSYDDAAIPYMYGIMLGDGYLIHDKNGRTQRCRLSFSHGQAQHDYHMTLTNMFKGAYVYTEPSNYKPDHLIYKSVINLSENLISSLYDDDAIDTHEIGGWHVTESFCNKLTWASLAIWYFDDGTLRHSHDNQQPSIEIALNSYNNDECNLLASTLKNKFGLTCKIRVDKNNKCHCLYIDVNSTKIFLKEISKYVTGDMLYKTLSSTIGSYPVFEYTKQLYYTTIISKSIYKPLSYKRSYVYDIEVLDNHNFFANDILNHNCQNMPQLFKEPLKDLIWIATEKIDGTSTTFTMKQAKPKKREMLVCSRNVVYNTPEKEDRNFYKDSDGNVYLEMAALYNMKDVLNYILNKHPEYEFITIQGETYGGTIQKRNYGPDHKFAVFNYIYKENGKAPVRLNPVEMSKEVDKLNDALKFKNKLWCVPIINTKFKLPETCDELLKEAGGESKIDGKPREGLVFRDLNGENSFKAVDNEFIVKYHSN